MRDTVKLLVSLSLGLLAINAQALSLDYYGGILFGVNSTQDKKDLAVYQTRGNPGQTFSLLPQSSSNTEPAYGFFVGARHKIEKYFVGAELSVQMQNASPSQSYTQISSTYTNDVQESLGSSIWLAIVPGMILSEKWDIYGKLGYVMSQFKATATNPGNFGPQGDFTQAISGVNLGVGALYHFNPRWSMALEYNYVQYSSFNIIGNDDKDIDGGAWGKVTAKYKLNSSAVILKASYWF
jgi:opacity protein-like surface antigen